MIDQSQPTSTTNQINDAITEALLEQDCTRYEIRGYRYEFDEPIADYDSSEDGSASWWWGGEIVDIDGIAVATFSVPDWYVTARSVEITW
tara:strand:+ start:90 stop:359 length:270 start_codon:yes stop_codon:yes gene_type:complete